MFHNFTTLSLVKFFSGLRKFKVVKIVAHQFMLQLDEDIGQAVLGNIGTFISFRIGTEDAKHMVDEIFPEFDVQDFINRPNYKIFLKLMFDGRPSRPISGNTLTNQGLFGINLYLESIEIVYNIRNFHNMGLTGFYALFYLNSSHF